MSTRFAAQTAILSTFAAAHAAHSTVSDAIKTNLSTLAAAHAAHSTVSDAIKVYTTSTGIRASVGLSTNNLDTQLANLSTQVSAISMSTSVTVDSTAIALQVWAMAVPSTFGAGTAGKVVGDYLTASVAAVSTQVAALSSNLSTVAASVGAVSTQVLSLSSAVNSSGVIVKHILTGGIGSSAYSTSALSLMGIVTMGNAANSASTSLTLASTTPYASAAIVGGALFITGDTGAGQARFVLAYDSTSKLASVDAWTTTPSSVAPYVLFAVPPPSVASPIPANVTQMASTITTAIQAGLATDTAMSTRFAAQTAILSTFAAAHAAHSTVSDAIRTFTISSGVRAALGLSTNNLDTQLANLSTQVAAISMSTSVTVDSTAIALQVWARAVPSTFGSGTAGKILGDYLNASILGVSTQVAALSSNVSTLAAAHAAHSTVSDAIKQSVSTLAAAHAAHSTVSDAIRTFTISSGVRAALGLSTNNLDTQLANLSTQIAGVTMSTSVSVNSTAIAAAVWADGSASTKIAGSVWNAVRSSYASTGTFGEVDTSTDVANAVWGTAVPSTFGLGTAGAVLGDYLNISLQGVSTQVAALTTAHAAHSTVSDHILALTQSSGIQASVGLSTNNLGLELSNLSALVEDVASSLAGLGTQVAALSTSVSSTAVAEATMNAIVESTVSLRQSLRGINGVLLGKASGSSGSTTIFRDLADSKNRVTAVTDTDGNRTTVTVNWS
jgi:hypothetical protein